MAAENAYRKVYGLSIKTIVEVDKEHQVVCHSTVREFSVKINNKDHFIFSEKINTLIPALRLKDYEDHLKNVKQHSFPRINNIIEDLQNIE